MPTQSGYADFHRTTAAGFARALAAVTDWDAPSPVAAWSAGDVVDHLLTWFPALLDATTGRRLDNRPGAPRAERWAAQTDAVQAILDDPASADVAIDDPRFPFKDLATMINNLYTGDVFMHTWDLAKAAGVDPGLDKGVAREFVSGMAEMDDVLRSSGQYGPKVETDSTDPVDQLMAFVGRDPAWRPPAR